MAAAATTVLGGAGMVTSITAAGAEIGLVGAAASLVCVALWGLKKARHAL